MHSMPNVLSASVLFDNTYLYIPKGAVPAFGFQIDHRRDHPYRQVSRPTIARRSRVNCTRLAPYPRNCWVLRSSWPLPQPAVGGLYVRQPDGGHRPQYPRRHGGRNAYDYLRNAGLWDTTWADRSTKLNGMNWLEYGFHYSAVLFDDGTDQWMPGSR